MLFVLGYTEVDQIITVLLRTNMLIGGVTGLILDNTIPGSREERGITVWRQGTEADKERVHVYDLPLGLRKLSSYRCAKYIPFLPYYPDYEPKDPVTVELKNIEATIPDADKPSPPPEKLAHE